MKDFANKLKNLRKERHLNQKDLAILLCVSVNSYSQYELGKTEPNFENLKKLADFFCVSVDYLIGAPTTSAGSKKEESLSIDEKEMLDNFDKLGPFEREAIMIQIKALAEKCGATEK